MHPLEILNFIGFLVDNGNHAIMIGMFSVDFIHSFYFGNMSVTPSQNLSEDKSYLQRMVEQESRYNSGSEQLCWSLDILSISCLL